jgi:hypothetical protein
MKNSIFFLLLSVAMLAGNNTQAQLSDRVNSPSKFKTGTRPITGNLGMFVGVSTDDIKKWTDKDSTTEVQNLLPLVSLKYYHADDLVFRIGVKNVKNKTVRDGKVDPNVNIPGGLTSKTNIEVNSEFYLTPAVEKHFLSSNILDPYVVVTIPLGYVRERVVNNEHYEFGDFSDHTMTKNSFAYGFETHIGLQAFIADLPLALGWELGMSGIGYRGEKYKHIENTSVGGVETNQTYYTYKDDPLNTKYSSLKSNSFEVNGSIRVTLSYYFSK